MFTAPVSRTTSFVVVFETEHWVVQVAQLRALAKTNPSAATVPAMSANSASQKAAALAAAALLQKKFGSTSGPGNADALHTHQSTSPDRYILVFALENAPL